MPKKGQKIFSFQGIDFVYSFQEIRPWGLNRFKIIYQALLYKALLYHVNVDLIREAKCLLYINYKI